jgi:quercetin dioxygenase-like cupin family protein
MNPFHRARAIAFLLATTAASESPALAQSPGSTSASCADTPALHALDFWLGEWTVRVGGDGQVAGTNRIERILGGCAITETWRDASGGEGRSLFYYLPVEGAWHQVWVTPNALRPGGVKEKRMTERIGDGLRFQGTIALPGGGSYLDRTTLTPESDGTVRQVIEVSQDDGTTWRTMFDGVYHRGELTLSPGAPARGVTPDSLAWRPAAPGVELAIAEGTPGAAGARFTMMLRFEDGSWIPPHWHNVEKVLTVISGELLLGEGNRLDAGATRRFGPGSVIVIPPERRHYEGGAGATLVSLTAMGPFRTTMVTPGG